MDGDTPKIQTLNDCARTTLQGCRVMIRVGVQVLEHIEDTLRNVREFNDFTEDNDPYGEHDFTSFQHLGDWIFWKFDYYDETLTGASDDPADPNVRGTEFPVETTPRDHARTYCRLEVVSQMRYITPINWRTIHACPNIHASCSC
jgi:hypothetical protein